ncbi:fatty-acid amide hydrolase 2-a [Plakobranchus ocellatus]|uniref:Fatty-acid amide hydrolase 2-a n=1 Tax=Plakobranchus ocellatus TaxID=259542 RepID=A0AAV3YYZ5_9GAST|nr:fatty-acid amide hydrolase 2-a [Plakobranchus ocellatus]
MSAYIMRAKEINPLVNAIVGEQYHLALRKAQELDRTLDNLSATEIEEKFSAKHKPLLGVPLSVKEAFAWIGMTNCSGVPSRKHIRSTYDAPVLKNLQDAGAIPFIHTNVSEACMWFESSNYVFGCTNNAYDTTRIVGGSSGGEGCVISAGAAVIGIGSDIGGSIRMPCFFNGIFGHKPSVGVVENKGQFPIASEKALPLLQTGPMCRYASDLIPELRAMAGEEGAAKLQLDTKVDLSRLRVISVPDDDGGLMVSKVDPQLKEAQRKVCEFLASKGACVEERKFHKFRMALDMWTGLMNLSDETKFAKIIAGENPKPVNCILELGKSAIGMSKHTFPALLLGVVDDFGPNLTKARDIKAVEILKKLKKELIEEMKKGKEENGRQNVDGENEAEGHVGENYQGTVLLYPSHPKIAPYHSHPIFTPFNFAYTGLFNALGLPVTQCPLGLSKEGLPLGLQVVSAPYEDHLSLAVAQALEEKFGGWVNPGSV